MIEECLKKGKGNAISAAELVALTGVNSVRQLQMIIANERKEGAVILSSSTGGYYLAANREEIEEFVRTQDKKARSIMVILQSARKLLKTAEGQIDFSDYEGAVN